VKSDIWRDWQGCRQLPGSPTVLPVITVKFYLRGGQELSLLCIGGRRIVLSVRSVNEYAHMNSTDLITRVVQGFFAAAAAGASFLILQFAMLA
jgi:hypothetical protein